MKLRWNPDEYLGITSIRVPSDRLWLPDVVLYDKYVTVLYINRLLKDIMKSFFFFSYIFLIFQMIFIVYKAKKKSGEIKMK